MNRPYCPCEEPTFVLYSPDEEDFVAPLEDTKFRGDLRVGYKKWREDGLEVFLAIEESKQNVIILKGSFPNTSIFFTNYGN